jgi:hypothetical protein
MQASKADISPTYPTRDTAHADSLDNCFRRLVLFVAEQQGTGAQVSMSLLWLAFVAQSSMNE